MKVAVTTQGDNLDAPVDPRFPLKVLEDVRRGLVRALELEVAADEEKLMLAGLHRGILPG